MRRWLTLLPPLIGVILFTLAAWTLHHQLQHHSYRAIATALRSISWSRIAPAVGITALGYLTLPFYDIIALRYVRETVPTVRVFFTSFVAYTFSQNFGLPLLTGTSVRYRFYTSWGVPVGQLVRAVGFSSISFWLGIVALLGTALLVQPGTGMSLLGLPLLGIVLAYLAWNALARQPLRVFGQEVRVPGLRLALAQLAVSVADWTLAALVLYLLLPRGTAVSFPTLLGAFLMAQALGIISHVPGGLGVFESALLALLGPGVANSAVVATLLAYRVVYYLLPLSVALFLLGGYEITRPRRVVAVGLRFIRRWIPLVVPTVLAYATFVAGAILLFSGATPAISSRLAGLDRFLPLAVIEVSHFVGSVVGMGLLLLALGLERRLDAAWHLAVGLLGLGIAASLFKGLDYEEAAFLLLVLAVLIASRGAFYRQAAMTAEPFSPGWLAAVVLVAAASVWLGAFAYRHVEYSQELWWRVTLRGDAPRFLRATVGVFATAGVVAAWRLLRPSAPRFKPAPSGDLDLALPIIQASSDPSANLALLGDKSLLFDAERTGFVMYATTGRSWVAMGDPIGPPAVRPGLAWQFREQVDRHSGWSIFYEVSADNLPIYVDLGLRLLKLGEEASVPLESFSLTGGNRKGLRRAHRQVEKEGCRFLIVEPAMVAEYLPRLATISAAWLAGRQTREKGFSMGFFDPVYLSHCPIAMVEMGGSIVAFANIWRTDVKEEISVDLMRHAPEAPAGVMDYLFIEVMLWAQAQGYRHFGLGMAPLSGFTTHALAPRWSRLGALLYRHGEHFYNFQGLRQYKEKFAPEWKPRYLASPGGLALPRILANVASLISGGLKGALTH